MKSTAIVDTCFNFEVLILFPVPVSYVITRFSLRCLLSCSARKFDKLSIHVPQFCVFNLEVVSRATGGAEAPVQALFCFSSSVGGGLRLPS